MYYNVNQCPELNDTHDICIMDCNSALYLRTMLKMVDMYYYYYYYYYYVVIVDAHYKWAQGYGKILTNDGVFT